MFSEQGRLMPTERLSMRRIRDLLRLRNENGLSTRLIATALGISKGAVGDYLQRARVAGRGWAGRCRRI